MPSENPPFRGLAYVSLYFKDLDKAVAFYSRVLGGPTETHEGDDGNYIGWEIGDTWLTFFPGKANPRSTEFALVLSSAALVDQLYDAFLEQGDGVHGAIRHVDVPEDAVRVREGSLRSDRRSRVSPSRGMILGVDVDLLWL